MVTKHATIRQKQRGISDLQLLLIKVFGEESSMAGNASELTISKKRRAEIVQALDKAINKALLISEENGNIITAYNKY